MGRSRIIKGDTFKSRSLARCTPLARLTFIGMWTEADDAGRGIADARVLAGALWPLDDDVTSVEVGAHLAELAATGHIILYAAADDTFFQILNWEKHQAAAYRRGEPRYPDPADSTVCTLLHASECRSVLEENGSEVKGREGSASVPLDPDAFDSFWDAYPRKEAKKPARVAFDKATKIVDLGTLVTALAPLQRKVGTADEKFIPLAASWLNAERWNDRIEPAPVKNWKQEARDNPEGKTWDPWNNCWMSNFAIGRS